MGYLYDTYGVDMDLDTSPANDYSYEFDLKLDVASRLSTKRERDSIGEALIRRIATPLYGYVRMVRLGDSTRILNPEYGTDLEKYLSEPISFVDEIQQEALISASKDERVNINEARLTKDMSTLGAGRVYLEMDYSVLNSSISDTVSSVL